MLGSRPFGPHSLCRRYIAETVGAVVNTRLPHRSKRFLNCVDHLQASPAADVTLHKQERNLPPPAIMQYFRFSLEVKKSRSDCAAPQKSFLAACSKRHRFQPLASKCLPCASPRSEHGILGKRRVKLRSPAVGRTPRGCQPDEQIRPRLSGTLWSAAVRVRGSRAQRRGRGTTQLTSPARNGGGG